MVEFRCEHCNKLLAIGYVKDGVIKIKCKYCKKLTLIKSK